MRDKAFNIARNSKNDAYQRGLASMVFKFFDKKTSGSSIKNENISNKELAKELQKPIIREFNKRKVYRQYLGRISSRYAIDKQIL